MNLLSQEILDKNYIRIATSQDSAIYPLCVEYSSGDDRVTQKEYDLLETREKVGLSFSQYDGYKDIGTYTSENDTVIIEGILYFFYNPFPNVFLHTENLIESHPGPGPYPTTTAGYTWKYERFNLIIASIQEDSLGTLIHRYDNGKLISKGHYFQNKENGEHIYMDLKGEIIRKEYYEKGKLINTVKLKSE